MLPLSGAAAIGVSDVVRLPAEHSGYGAAFCEALTALTWAWFTGLTDGLDAHLKMDGSTKRSKLLYSLFIYSNL